MIPSGTARFLRIELNETASVEDIEPKTIKLYPNPTSKSFQLEFIDDGFHDAHITIYNILGSVIEQRKVEMLKTEVNVQNWSSGVYFVHVREQNKIQTIKVVVD